MNSFKRLFKDFGIVPVALVLLTQTNPADVIRAIYVRVSYILFPLSMVFIKYYPEIGRQSTRAGDNMFTGVTTQKNTLGEVVFVFGLMLLWDIYETWKATDRPGRKKQLAIRGGMFLLGLWLLITCDSQTSLLCLIIGTFAFWGIGKLQKMPNGKRVFLIILAAVAFVVTMDKTFGISDKIIVAMGRDPSLTGRTGIWKVVLAQHTDSLVGEGFCIFWDTDKGSNAIDELMLINSAHNGYLEMYLDGGMIGATLLVLLLLTAGWGVINRCFAGSPLGRMALIFWILAIVFNFSESSYFRLGILWTTLLLMLIDHPPRVAQRQKSATAGTAEPAGTPPAPAGAAA
jgi:O-antigen ligase